MSSKNSDTWRNRHHAGSDGMVMRESRMQGQLACPVWRGLGRNDSQQWEDRAPLLPYITKLLGPAKWNYYYLYVVLDLFSRKVVGWMIAGREAAELVEQLVTETCVREGIPPDQLTLHADRGSAMIAKSLALLLTDLGVRDSHSRPHISNDNPYSEAQFKTLKYHPTFPTFFGSLADARGWAQTFFTWYNNEHHHTGLGLLTPSVVHAGQAATVQAQRQTVLQAAYTAHPERFVHGRPVPPILPTAAWINPPQLAAPTPTVPLEASATPNSV